MLLLLWLECRLLAGRPTVGAGKFIIFFGIGAVGASICAVITERVSLLLLPAATASFTVAPVVEELAKAAPLMFIAFWTVDGRRLTVADLALMGLSVGLGFQFVETNLQVIASGVLPNFVTPFIAGFVQAADHLHGANIYDPGHAVSTGLVGLAIGVGMRLLGSLRRAQALTALALLLVIFDHAMFDWKVAHSLANGAGALSFPNASAPLEAIYWITLHSWLEPVLLAAGLLLTAWLEGRRQWVVLAARSDLLLPGERLGMPLPNEWLIGLRRLQSSWHEMQQTLTYFRHRRALALAQVDPTAGAEMTPGGHDSYLSALDARLGQERERLAASETSRAGVVGGESLPLIDSLHEALRLPAEVGFRHAIRAALERFTSAFRLLLLVSGVLIAAFLLLRATGLIDHLYGRPLDLLIALAALTYAGWRVRGFRRQQRPDPAKSDGEELATYHAHALLVFAALGIAAFAVVVWFLPKGVLSPTAGLAFVLGTLDQWTVATGGSASGLLALGGLAAPPENCPERASYEAPGARADMQP
jgi:hypothetical protein